MHKHALDPRPDHGLAWHPQRGVREARHLRPGWRWLNADEVERYHATGEAPRTTPLVKPGVIRRAVR